MDHRPLVMEAPKAAYKYESGEGRRRPLVQIGFVRIVRVMKRPHDRNSTSRARLSLFSADHQVYSAGVAKWYHGRSHTTLQLPKYCGICRLAEP